MMKYVLALCVASAMAVMAQSCSSSGKDCAGDECCVSYFFSSRCEKRTAEGKSCDLIDDSTPAEKYRYRCPCQEDLECANQKERKIFGRITQYDPRCQKKKPVTDEPDIEEPETGEPETGEPETGEPETGEPETGEPETGEPETGEPETEE